MLDKLDRLEEEYRELEALLSDPEVLKDKGRYQSLSRRYAEMGEVIGLIREYRKVLEDLEQAESLLDDPELKEMARRSGRPSSPARRPWRRSWSATSCLRTPWTKGTPS